MLLSNCRNEFARGCDKQIVPRNAGYIVVVTPYVPTRSKSHFISLSRRILFSFHSDRSDALTSEEIDMMYERQVAGTHNLSAIKFRLLSLIKILPRHVWNWPNNPYIGRVKRPDNPNIGRVK